MYRLKDYPEDFTKSNNKSWGRFKKIKKRQTNKSIRRDILNYKKFKGHQIAW